MNPVAKVLIAVGLLLVVVGVFWQLGGRFLPLGRLPGDLVIERENVRIYFPLVTMLLLSLVLSLLLALGRYFLRP